MARSLRIERENGLYHVINRGNYRQDLFINEGAHRSFESCLFEACEKSGWILEGFCVMTNHFHLVVRTPRGNLSWGMKWLLGTFANRYHRFRKVNGKLFQGRFKSLIVEEDAYLGSLLHYVHLNPVRAGICDVAGLGSYRWSSYWYLRHPKSRPGFLDPTGALWHAGKLADTPSGHRGYASYLRWLAADAGSQKELAFEKMCRGWALGSREFKMDLLKSEGLLKDGDFEALRMEGRDLVEVNELLWEELLERGFRAARETEATARNQKKSEQWKIWVAAEMKRRTTAPNAWIAKRLHMGVPHAVTIHVSAFECAKNKHSRDHEKFIERFTK
jgi:REP element-mobilizing transposase RayT